MNQERPIRTNLFDGVNLNFISNDRYKTNYITFYFVTPLNKKTASYNTLLSRVITRGCEKYPDQMRLNRALDEGYDASLLSDTSKVGEWHALSVSLSLLDNAFSLEGEDITALGTDILEEVLFHPYAPSDAFDAEFVASEKKLALAEIDSLVNHKARYARGRMIDHMCRLEPYSTCAIGTKSEIKKITPTSLFEYYKEMMKTAQIEIFFVGRFDHKAVEKRVKALFFGRERAFSKLPDISIRTKARATKEITERMDVTQAHLVMGFRTACTIFDSEWRAFSLYNSVLGGSLTSKLFCNLREKMSLCYSVSSMPDAMKGMMMIYAGIAPENREVAIKEALFQMKEIENGNITEEELENARGALIHSMRGLGDNPAALSDWYLPRMLTETITTPQEIIEELLDLKKEDVVAVSKKVTLDTVYTLTGKEAE